MRLGPKLISSSNMRIILADDSSLFSGYSRILPKSHVSVPIDVDVSTAADVVDVVVVVVEVVFGLI